MKSLPLPDLATIRAARAFYFAEQLGGELYARVADATANEDVRHALGGFAGDEHRHADWYLDWLLERGVAPPRLEGIASRIAPAARRILAARSLEAQLALFSEGERAAARHLRVIAERIRDPSLRAIVERTIPAEEGHALWFPESGMRMLGARDRVTPGWSAILRPTSTSRNGSISARS